MITETIHGTYYLDAPELCVDTVIRRVNKPGHPWHEKFVVVEPWASGSVKYYPHEVCCQLPEQQSLPEEKRLSCRFLTTDLEIMSIAAQEQVANTLCLRREKLPYLHGI